jgi:transposase
MMGERTVMQEALFYEFSIDRHVPADHLLRSIDRFVDLSDLRSYLQPFYSEIGRPSIDPELIIRMLIVGYCFGIRSERRLCEEVHLNLAYRWFCRLGLEGDVPDHSTFSKNRHGRFRDSDLLRELFETTVRRCIEEGLVGGEGFAVDASLIRADANRQRSAEGAEPVDWKAMAETRRSVQEYLDTLDDAAWGAASEVRPKFVSRSDPAAQWTGALKGHAFFAYATNYLIDMDHAIIVDVEASRAIRQAEVGAARTMIERTQDRFGLWPERLAADSAYGSAENLAWLVHERGIEPHIPVFDKSERKDGTFERAAFTYDHRRDLCPGGKELRQRQKVYRTPRPLVDERCDTAPASSTATPVASRPAIVRTHRPARSCGRSTKVPATWPAISQPPMPTSPRDGSGRRSRCCSRILKLDRLRLRGPNGARDEFHLAAAAQNLRKLAKMMPMPAPKPA